MPKYRTPVSDFLDSSGVTVIWGAMDSPEARPLVSLELVFVISILTPCEVHFFSTGRPGPTHRAVGSGGCSCGLRRLLSLLLPLLEGKVFVEDHGHHGALLLGLSRRGREPLHRAVDRGDAVVDVLHRHDTLQLLLGDAQEARELGDAALELVHEALVLGHLSLDGLATALVQLLAGERGDLLLDRLEIGPPRDLREDRLASVDDRGLLQTA